MGRKRSNRAKSEKVLAACHRMTHARLVKRGELEAAAAYAAAHGLDPRGRGFAGGEAGNVNESTSSDLKIKNVRGPLDDAEGIPKRISDEGGAVTPSSLVATPRGIETAIEASLAVPLVVEEPVPEFKPARDVLPKGVRWARVVRQAVNRRLREVLFEDNNRTGALWLTERQVCRGEARLGKTVPVTWNDDELRPDSWKLWKK